VPDGLLGAVEGQVQEDGHGVVRLRVLRIQRQRLLHLLVGLLHVARRLGLQADLVTELCAAALLLGGDVLAAHEGEREEPGGVEAAVHGDGSSRHDG
jgi:hypothetical protein